MLTPAQRRTADQIVAGLNRMIRYDDGSVVNDVWIRRRYDCGSYQSYALARQAAVRVAWHEAGHAIAALATGATFTSASIHHGTNGEGRVHRIRADSGASFVIDAAGQIAERLMDWTMLESDDELARWLRTWRGDGGDARRFRQAIRRLGTDEASAWRYSESVLVPLRPQVRYLARGLLMHHAHLPYGVVAALADAAIPAGRVAARSPLGGSSRPAARRPVGSSERPCSPLTTRRGLRACATCDDRRHRRLSR